MIASDDKSVASNAEVAALEPDMLDYAPAPSCWRHRATLWSLVIALIVMAATTWGPGACRRAQLLHYQRQCLAYRAPSDQVVTDDMRFNRDYCDTGTWQPPVDLASPAPTPVPVCYLRYLEMLGMNVPQAVRNTRQSTQAPPVPVVFMHERTSKGGTRRLVILLREPSWRAIMHGVIGDTAVFTYVAVSPGTVFQTPMVTQRRFARIPGFWRVYASQPDAQDASHFTITYEDLSFRDGKVFGRGTLHGWLQDDGSVLIKDVPFDAGEPK